MFNIQVLSSQFNEKVMCIERNKTKAIALFNNNKKRKKRMSSTRSHENIIEFLSGGMILRMELNPVVRSRCKCKGRQMCESDSDRTV